ncbi:MAG: glycosyltransferase family 4 protein [Planctomycetes bacterium]|nr:glycosyltransferase family 4 protein [Planctomycetota bacterium]MBI3846966.1 glycosyltransferase family 4 protein [Planctomycetota bacterium]
MRIAVVIDHFFPKKGGAEAYLDALALECQRRGHSVAVVARSKGEGSAPVAFHEVRAASFPRWWREVSFLRGARRVLDVEGFDVSLGIRHCPGVTVYQPHGGVHREALRAQEEASGSVVSRIGHALAPKQWFFRWAEKEILTGAHRPLIVAVSRRVQEDLARDFGVPVTAVRVIPNGVDVQRFRPDPTGRVGAAVRRDLGIGDDEVVALFVAHQFRLKGLDPLLRALARLGDRAPRLLVMGRDDPRPWVALSRGLRRGVRFLGDVRAPAAFYLAADLFVHPTFYDPCSLVVLEALASGTPVLTTRRNGASELMTDGVEGVIIDHPNDVAGLVSAIERLLDRDRRVAMGTAARRAAERVAWPSHADRMIAILEEASRQ